MSGSTLSNVNFNDANLRGADLSSADLCGANLENADLRGAMLNGALLFNANLKGAGLRNADLEKADMRDALWADENRNLGADLEERRNTIVKMYVQRGLMRPEAAKGCFKTSFVVHPYATILQDADLRGANLAGAKISEQQLGKTKFRPEN